MKLNVNQGAIVELLLLPSFPSLGPVKVITQKEDELVVVKQSLVEGRYGVSIDDEPEVHLHPSVIWGWNYASIRNKRRFKNNVSLYAKTNEEREVKYFTVEDMEVKVNQYNDEGLCLGK